MLELSEEERLELEKRVADKVHAAFPGESNIPMQQFYENVALVASRATIMTIREYEKMQAERQGRQPNQQ